MTRRPVADGTGSPPSMPGINRGIKKPYAPLCTASPNIMAWPCHPPSHPTAPASMKIRPGACAAAQAVSQSPSCRNRVHGDVSFTTFVRSTAAPGGGFDSRRGTLRCVGYGQREGERTLTLITIQRRCQCCTHQRCLLHSRALFKRSEAANQGSIHTG